MSDWIYIKCDVCGEEHCIGTYSCNEFSFGVREDCQEKLDKFMAKHIMYDGVNIPRECGLKTLSLENKG